MNKTGYSLAPPSLLDITSAPYTVWAVGTDRQKHKSAPMAWTAKQNLVRVVMQHRSVSVCSCRASMFEIMNLSVQRRIEWSHVRGRFYEGEESEKHRIFLMYQVYIIYYSIHIDIIDIYTYIYMI